MGCVNPKSKYFPYSIEKIIIVSNQDYNVSVYENEKHNKQDHLNSLKENFIPNNKTLKESPVIK